MCIELESKNDDLKQYTRRKNLRISGIPENVRENADDLVNDFFTNTIKVEVDMNEIDRSHRVERPGSKLTRNIILFLEYLKLYITFNPFFDEIFFTLLFFIALLYHIFLLCCKHLFYALNMRGINHVFTNQILKVNYCVFYMVKH